VAYRTAELLPVACGAEDESSHPLASLVGTARFQLPAVSVRSGKGRTVV